MRKRIHLMLVFMCVFALLSACGKENSGQSESVDKQSSMFESGMTEDDSETKTDNETESEPNSEENNESIGNEKSIEGFYNCTQMEHSFTRADFEIKAMEEDYIALFYVQYTDVDVYESELFYIGTKISDDTYEFVSDDIKYNAVWDGKDKLTVSGDELAGVYERGVKDGYGEGDYAETDMLTYEADKNVETGIEIDKTLANAIRKELGYDEGQLLTYEDLESITYLAAWQQGIASIKGISYLKNLEEIHIDGGYINDISEFAKLENISFIDITDCYIKEIPDLSMCTKLTSLYLSGNMIKDISQIANIKSLKYVNLGNNIIRYISPLKDVDFLQSLSMDANCILDYASIKDSAGLIKAYNEGTQCTYEQALSLENRVKEIVDEFPSDISELELEKLIYKYIMDNMYFSEKIKAPAPYGYYGIVEGWGVCGDYSEAFALIANHAGLEAYNCYSDTHAWNVIKIDGVYYHCDALWDDDAFEWRYFNKSTGYIYNISDHMHDVARYPICDISMSVLEYMECFNNN